MKNAIATDEPLLPLRRAIGHRLGSPHRATLARWAARGLRTANGTVVKLAALKVGARLMTTRAAADRFCNAVVAVVSADDGGTTALSASPPGVDGELRH